MNFVSLFVFLLVASLVDSGWCHHHHHNPHTESRKSKEHLDHTRKFSFKDGGVNVLPSEVTENSKKSLNIETTKGAPFSPRRLEKMLEKAILKIITGDLSTANMLLLKSLNYSSEEVSAIRERELNRKKDEDLTREQGKKVWKSPRIETEKKKKHWEENSMESDYSSPAKSNSEDKKHIKRKNHINEKSSKDKDFDFDAYNRQAVIDYENLAEKFDVQHPWTDPVLDYEEVNKESTEKKSDEDFHRTFDKAMEPHVVFKIRYDDSEFDSSSNSDEFGKDRTTKASRHHGPSPLGHPTLKNSGSFLASLSSSTSIPMHTPLPVVYRLGTSLNRVKPKYPKNHPYSSTTEFPKLPTTATPSSMEVQSATKIPYNPEEANTVPDHDGNVDPEVADHSEKTEIKGEQQIEETKERVSEYEGLEWVEDDVYRVIPAVADSLGYENNEGNETSDYEDNYYGQNFSEGGENDTLEYQNDGADSVKLFMANTNVSIGNLSMANLSTYQQIALAHRREGNLTANFDSQGQKAIEDIKSRVLALTGRFNLSTNTNQIQREKLTMFSPTCQIPRNTDPDAWVDPFSMNMHFQLNLTAGDHVVAAKLRIFKLPQENLTVSAGGNFEEEEEDEKKIRISIYYYTKSLKKHRSKKRLMDSVVTPLTPEGTHLALDVRQGLRFWRLNPRNPHGNGSNHGLVIQVEDQDGRPLKPALYIQQPSCAEQDSDQKTSAYLHFSYEPVLVTFAS